VKRAALLCRYERKGEIEPSADGNSFHEVGGVPPCWKAYVVERDGAGVPRRELDGMRDWCEPCLERDAVHRDCVEANALRGGAERALLALAKRSFEARAGETAGRGA
jgi:hypothetical protein